MWHVDSGNIQHEQRRPGSGGSKHSTLEKVRRVEKTGNRHQRCYQGNAEKHNINKKNKKNEEIRSCWRGSLQLLESSDTVGNECVKCYQTFVYKVRLPQVPALSILSQFKSLNNTKHFRLRMSYEVCLEIWESSSKFWARKIKIESSSLNRKNTLAFLELLTEPKTKQQQRSVYENTQKIKEGSSKSILGDWLSISLCVLSTLDNAMWAHLFSVSAIILQTTINWPQWGFIRTFSYILSSSLNYISRH